MFYPVLKVHPAAKYRVETSSPAAFSATTNLATEDRRRRAVPRRTAIRKPPRGSGQNSTNGNKASNKRMDKEESCHAERMALGIQEVGQIEATRGLLTCRMAAAA